MRLGYVRFEGISEGLYAVLCNKTIGLFWKRIRNGWKLHLVMENSVWRRLRRAKRGSLGKNKILEGYFWRGNFSGVMCGFEKSIYTL